MLDRIGTIAVRTLGTDIANLTARLAVQGAVLEELINQATTFDLTAWTHTPLTDESGELQTGVIITVPVEEYEKVVGILSTIGRLQ
jgi:hypothetical protein